MERCSAAHQVTRDRAGKCGNAGVRCYAHTMLDMLSISADKGKGSADETWYAGTGVNVYLNLIICCPHYMTAAEIAGWGKNAENNANLQQLVYCRMSGN